MKEAGSVNVHRRAVPWRGIACYSFVGMQSPVTSAMEPQSAAAVLMVRPAHFGFNPETAASNPFQVLVESQRGNAAQNQALCEFDGLAAALARSGVEVVVADDSADPVKPDAIFPNNWVSFHRDGTVVLYPMMAANRRAERREEVVRQVLVQGEYRSTRTVDLSHREAGHQFLEGTGSLVLDRVHRIAYASLSPRTHLDVLGEFAQQLDYDLVTFEAGDSSGTPIYHTNVLMAVGSRFAVLCSAAITDGLRRVAVAEKLRSTGHELIDISATQMQSFAGNILELEPRTGNVIALSTTAWGALQPPQQRVLERHGLIVAVDVPVIERLGGGGVRCMLAEIHLPKR